MVQNGPVQGDAAHGFDRPYLRREKEAAKELADTMPASAPHPPVPRDDTEMKNPDGDLYDPAAKPAKENPHG